MKVLNITRTSLVLGLILMVLVLWTAASPGVVSTRTVIGGFGNSEGECCTGTTASNCGSECGGWAVTVCDTGGSGPATCSCATPENACDDIEGCNWCDAACGTQ